MKLGVKKNEGGAGWNLIKERAGEELMRVLEVEGSRVAAGKPFVRITSLLTSFQRGDVSVIFNWRQA